MRFADREGMEVISVYKEAGKSGKTIEGRPEFKRMLHDIKNGLDIEYVLGIFSVPARLPDSCAPPSA